MQQRRLLELRKGLHALCKGRPWPRSAYSANNRSGGRAAPSAAAAAGFQAAGNAALGPSTTAATFKSTPAHQLQSPAPVLTAVLVLCLLLFLGAAICSGRSFEEGVATSQRQARAAARRVKDDAADLGVHRQGRDGNTSGGSADAKEGAKKAAPPETASSFDACSQGCG